MLKASFRKHIICSILIPVADSRLYDLLYY